MRGFYCTYAVIDRHLKLRQISIDLDLKNSLLIKHGRGGIKLFDRLPKRSPPESYSCTHQLDNLNEPIKFTGGLLIGSNFIWELYECRGDKSAYKFHDVWEIIFRSGQLIESIDRSQQMSELRKFVDFNKFLKFLSDPGKEKLQQWIESDSMLDYARH